MLPRTSRRVFSRTALLAAASLLGAASYGATLTWNGGLPGDWNTSNTNWTGLTWNNATPDDAVFNNLNGTITLTEAITAGSVSFNWNGNSGTTRSPVLTGGTLTVTGGITVDGYGLGGSGVDSVEQAYNVRAQISNTTNVTGNVTVRRGMLYLSGATLNVGGAISSWDAWSVFRSDNSTVTATGGIDFSAIASAVDLQGGTVTTPFIKVGNHTPANSGLFMAGGVRIIATGNSTDFIQVYNSGNTGSRAAATLNAGGVNLDTSTFAVTISTVLNGAGGLTKSGNGTLTLSGANTYAGGTTVSAGTLIIASQANTGGSSSLGNSAPSNLVTIGNGGTLTGNIWNWLDNTGLTAGGTNAHAVQVDAGGTLKGASGFITGLGNITLNGGTIEVSNGFVNGAWNGAFTLGGDITVTGTTASAITTSAGAGASANLQMSNGANSVGGTRTFRVNDVTASAASDLVVSARLANGTIVKEGAGTLELTSAPGTGTPVNWTVNAGALKLDLGARSGNASIGEFAVASPAALNLDNTNTTVGDYFPQGFVLSGSGTVTKNGVGSIDFWTGSNLTGFTGTMDIQQGSLRLNNIGANGNMGQATLNIASGATFDVRHASSLSVDKLTGSGTLDQSYNSGSGLSVTVGANNGSGEFGGVIQNSSGQPLSLTKSGNGTLTLSGTNSYGGKTFITGGTIIAASSTALGVGGHNGTTMAEISDGATLALQGGISLDEHFHVWGAGVGGFGAVRSLSGNNALTNAPGGNAGFCLRSNTTVGVDADTLTVTGFYEDQGSFGLTKVGSGTLVLTVSNTYTGGTTVNGGTLALGGSRGVLRGAVTINSGGTVSMATGNDNRYWDVASTRINAGGLLTMAGHSHLQNLTLAGGELGGSGGDPGWGTWYFDNATTVTGGVVSTLSAQNIYLANGNLSIEAGSTLNFTGSVKGGSFIPTIAAGGKLTNGAAANTSLSLGTLVLNGGELAATSAPASNLGNYQLRGDVTVGGSSMSTISADVRVGDNATRTFDVADVDGGSGVDLLISGKIGHFNGSSWGYATKTGAGAMKISGVNEIGGLTVNAGLLILEDTGITGFGATGLTNNAAAELRVTSGTATSGYGISGSGSLTKSGNGTLRLTGNNTYGGGTIVTAGTLVIDRQGDQTSSAVGVNKDVSVASGATLRLAQTDGLGYWAANPSSLVIAGTMTIAAGKHASIGNFGMTLNGATLTAEGVGSSEGNYIFDGTVTSLANAASSVISAPTIKLRNGNGAANQAVIFDVADGAAATDLSVSSVLINGNGTNGLTKAGNGTLRLAAANSYGGATTINGGTLVLDAGGTYAYAGGNIAINGGSTLRVSGLAYTFNGKTIAFGAAGGGTLDAIATGAGGMYLTGANTITTSGGAQNTLSGTKLSAQNQGINLNSQTLTFDVAVGADPAVPNLNITGTLWNSGNLTKSGNGILLLSGNSEYSGTTTINAGTLIFRGASASSSHGIATGAVLEFNATGGERDGAATTFTGAGTLRKTGAGGIIWGSGTATFALDSGALIDVQAGLFTGGSYGNDVWTNNKSDLNVASGATFNTVEANVRVNKITGTGTIKTGYGGAGYANLTIGVDNGSSAFAGVIENADANGNLVKAGTGAIMLSGANTYSGSTTVNDGTLKVTTLGTAGGSSVGSSDRSNAANLLLNGPVILEYAGAGESTSRSFTVSGSGLTLSSTGAGAVNFNTDSLIVFADSHANRELKLNGSNTGANTFGSSLSGTPADADKINKITKDGVGTWILSGPANRFRNALSIDVNAGTLGLSQGSVDLSGDGALIALNAGATLRWEAGNTADLASRLYLLPAGQNTEATVEIVAGTVSFSGPLASGSNLTFVKAGAGTLEFNTDQPEISGVRVNSGKLTAKADGALGAGAATVAGGTLSIAQGVFATNAINVSSGGTLSGKGTTGAVTVASGGIISPGSSPGVLTHASLALSGGSIINWEVYDATGSAGIGYDRLVVTGNLDLTGASSSSRIILKISSLTAQDANGEPLNFGAPNGVSSIRTFQFGQVGNVLLNNGENISDVFAFDVSDFTYTGGAASNAGLWSISWDGAGAITLTAVPEPSTYGLGLGALALAAAALRRRRRQDAKA